MKRTNLRLLVTCALIVVMAGGLTAIGVTWPQRKVIQAGASTATATGVNGATPQPWQYDPIKNQHWHAGHGHWHPGPPPPESNRAITPNVTPLPGSVGLNTATPLPWEYDAANNQHWHAEHGHWHPGPPPEGVNSPNYTQPAGAGGGG